MFLTLLFHILALTEYVSRQQVSVHCRGRFSVDALGKWPLIDVCVRREHVRGLFAAHDSKKRFGGVQV